MTAPKPATPTTATSNTAAATRLPLAERADHERATRGRIATHPTGQITSGDRMVWDIARHDFVRDREDAPDSVHPSLWRQARLNCEHGLFEVAPPARTTDGSLGVGGVWQARGYDLSNVTFISGETGWIVIDPLTAAETAAACLALANDTLGERPVVAVIYTHSHVDHFGGVLGVTNQADVDAGRVSVIAPEGFLDEAVSENVIAGTVMLRRAMYMYGALLPNNETGQVDAGLGKITPLGSVGLIAPTEEICETGAEKTIDGVRIVFQMTPGAEAPAEMNFHFPDLRLLCMAENCTHTMHNLYTPRGALVRDALAWSKYIGESIDLYADETDIVFASHHWPRFGSDDARGFLEQQRDLYRWLHDQTMRLANHGLTSLEIAEALDLAPELETEFHVRGYYGTVSHNVKAVYQRYVGFFDGNPANLHPLPPVETARKTVEYMGGADAVLARARADFEAGEYRWVAQIVNQVVFADPDNVEARELQADVLEQLGYVAESAPWRNFYLTGAQELRSGTFDFGTSTLGGFAPAMTTEMLFDSMGVRLLPDEIGSDPLALNLAVTDRDEVHVLGVSNRTLFHRPARTDPDAPTITLSSQTLIALLDGAVTVDAALAAGDVAVDGDPVALTRLFGALDRFPRIFPIVTP